MKFLLYVPQMAEYGGMERHICLLALLLREQGHLVTLMTTSNSLNDKARDEFRTAGVEFLELPVARGEASKLVKYAWLLLHSARLRSRNWDFIYTNGQSGLARLPWLARNGHTRIAHHHHTAGDSEEQKTWHPAFRRALAAAPELIACSKATKANMEAVVGRKDVVFLPYLTPELASPSSPPPSDSVLHFGFAGRLVPTKGIDTICQLSAEPDLNGIRWHIHGTGEDYPASYFAQFPNVEFHGPYTNAAEGARILQGLDALALFSRHNEGMPLSLIEAMGAGLPWIATDRGGTRELAVVAQNCELVRPDASFDEIKAQTVALASRIRAGLTSRKEQRRVYEEQFSYPAAARRWLEFIEGRPRA